MTRDPDEDREKARLERVRLTEGEWAAVIYSAVAALVLVAIVVVLVRTAGTDLIRAVSFGLGGAALALLASIAVVHGFRRTVVRPVEDPGSVRRQRAKGVRAPGAGRQLKGVDLRGARLIGVRLESSDLVEARLDGANLSYARLDRALLAGASLVGAVLERASLNSADLRHADLTRADLTGAQLSGADLRYAQLQGAVLRDANLRGATLVKADLRRVDLEGVLLTGARVRGADLRSTGPLPELAVEQLEEAVTNKQPGFSSSLKEAGKDAQRRIRRRRQ